MKYWEILISLLIYLRFIECQKIEIINANEIDPPIRYNEIDFQAIDNHDSKSSQYASQCPT